MRAVAILEATAKFPELCQTVQRTGEAVQITDHGRPVAVIAPWREPPDQMSVWAARQAFERHHGPLDEEFDVPERKMDEQARPNPLD